MSRLSASSLGCKRIACVFVPYFAMNASGAKSNQRHALVKPLRQRTVIHSCTRAAQDQGVTPGMTLSDARALVKDLATQPLDERSVQKASYQLAQWLWRYTPLVGVSQTDVPHALGGTAVFWLDMSGASHLFGGEDAVMQDVVQRLARLGFDDVRVAMAPTPGAAWALTHYGDKATQRISSQDVRLRLMSLPPAALRLNDKTLEVLDRLGLRDIGQILAMPRQELGQRFPEHSDALLKRLDQALGQVAESIDPIGLTASYACRQLFTEPIQHIEPIEYALAYGLETIIPSLERDQRGVRQVDVMLFRLDGLTATKSVRTSAATRNITDLCRLFQGRFEGLDVGFGIDAVLVSISRHDAMIWQQNGLLTPEGASSSHAVFDRIANRIGSDRVRQLRPLVSHMPGRDHVAVPLEQIPNNAAQWQNIAIERLAVGYYQDEEILEQYMNKMQRAEWPIHQFLRPQQVEFTRHGQQASMLWRRLWHRLVRLQGPKRISPDWWKPHITNDPGTNTARDYYRATDDAGRSYFLFEVLSDNHAPTNQWFIVGMF